MPRQSLDWETMFSSLVAYQDEYGNCEVPTNWDKNPRLGRWVAMQRHRVKTVGLPEEQADRLTRLGFVWDPGEKAWAAMFQRLVDYKKKHGECDVPTEYPSGQDLSDWVANQRARKKKGQLSSDRIKKLDEIGINWSVYKTNGGNAVQVASEPISQQGDEDVPLSAAGVVPVAETAPFAGGKIDIPGEYKDLPVKDCGFSIRLVNALTKSGIKCLGDLDGNRFETFKPAGYHRTSQLELSNFLGRMMAGQFQPSLSARVNGKVAALSVSLENLVIDIPVEYQNLLIRELWVDGLIQRKLKRLQISTLGDMHGRRFEEITSGKAGEAILRQWVDEINQNLYKVKPMGYAESVIWLIRHIEKVLDLQKPDDVEKIEARLRKEGSDTLTLEEVAIQFGVTRERVRLIEEKIITEIVKSAALQGLHAVSQIIQHCERDGFPLVVDEMERLIKTDHFDPKRKMRFYALMLHLTYSDLPVWIRMPNKKGVINSDSTSVELLLSEILDGNLGKCPWRTCYFLCLQKDRGLSLKKFIHVVIACSKIFTETIGGVWFICLNKIDVLGGVRAVLADSETLLTTLEITQIGVKRFGDQWPERDARGLENKLTYDATDIFRLESGRWGLAKHITTSSNLWPILQERFARTVQEAGHPVTTTEFLKKDGKEFAGKTNEYELMAILRRDPRFAKAERMFKFGLSEPGTGTGKPLKVPKVTDVILGMLRQHSSALKSSELKKLAQNVHSFSENSFGAAITKLKQEGLVRQTSTGAYCLK